MKSKNIIRIDLNVWQLQSDRAKEKGYSIQYISKLIREGKIKFWKIEELGLVLVRRDPETKEKPIAATIELPKDFVNATKVVAVDAKGNKINIGSDYLERRRKAKLG